MALKVKVLASSTGQASFSMVPKIVYRAVAVPEEDGQAPPVWICLHEHSTPLDAVSCGQEWLALSEPTDMGPSRQFAS